MLFNKKREKTETRLENKNGKKMKKKRKRRKNKFRVQGLGFRALGGRSSSRGARGLGEELLEGRFHVPLALPVENWAANFQIS